MNALRHNSVFCLYVVRGRRTRRGATRLSRIAAGPWACLLAAAVVAQPAPPASEARAAVERVALAKARGELMDKVYALKLDEDSTVGDWAARDLARDRALRLWLRKLPAQGAPRFYSDSSCDLSVRLNSAALLQELQRMAASQPAGTAPTPDLARAAAEWPALWGQGSAARTEQQLASQPEGWEDVTAEGLEMTRRAAEADARHALLDAIGGLPVTRARRLSVFLDSGAEVRNAVVAALQREASMEVVFAPDQVAVATVRIGVLDLVRVLTDVHETSYQGDLFHATDFPGMALLAMVDEVSATGLAVPPPTAMSRPGCQPLERDVPAWAGARMTASGRYVPAADEKLSPPEQAEAACLNGMDRLRQGVEELVIEDGLRVSTFLASHPELKDDINIFLSGARPAGPATMQPGGVVEVPIELPLRRLWWIVCRGMQPAGMDLSDESTSRPAEKDAP